MKVRFMAPAPKWLGNRMEYYPCPNCKNRLFDKNFFGKVTCTKCGFVVPPEFLKGKPIKRA